MMFRALCCLCLLAGSVSASDLSIGQFGINAAPLQAAPLALKGMNIAIGQVEPGRPGMEGVDSPANRHDDVDPVGVFRFNQSANTADVRSHAESVAGVMISKHTGALVGVAPAAQLYSSAAPNESQEDHLRALDHIASLNSRDVRAINMSYGLRLIEGLDSTDGNSYFTRGVDWLATAYDNTLFVVAGNEGDGGVPLPTDNYNGLVVGYSNQQGNYFRRVGDLNSFVENPTQARTAIGLIAPGEGFPSTDLNSTSTTPPHPGGTSFAAPHVTGTVALIQEIGERNLTDIGGIHWTGNHREHEVSKAVLLNSADKLEGVHGSARTVVSSDAFGNYTWEQSLAHTNDHQPLDIQFGAGHLNALRAVTQISAGEWDGSSDIPLIGWDFGETGGVGTTLRYTFEDELPADEWIAITLTWDREVFKTGGEDSFTPGDMFTVGQDNGLSNLN
jgi:subtilisin family serine protease